MTDITFVAQVAKVQTLVDGGIRLTLDLGEGDTLQMAQLAKCQQFGCLLDCHCFTVENSKGNNGKLETRAKRQSTWATEETAVAD